MTTKPKAPRSDRPCDLCGDMMYQVLNRATSCAACSSLKSDAYRRNRYGQFLAGMEQAREAGLSGQEARDAATGNADAAIKAKYAADAAREEARRQHAQDRAQQNAILRQHGYRWTKEEIGSEDDWAGRGSVGGGIGETVGYAWVLEAPDGSEVGVQQALRQIESGAIPTKEQAEARWAAERERSADLQARGYFRSDDDLFDAFIAAYGPLADRAEDARTSEEMRAADAAQGFRWHSRHVRGWMAEHGKTTLRHGGDLADESTLLSPADLPAMVAAAQEYSRAQAAQWQRYQEAEEAERREREQYPDALVLPSTQAALNRIFDGMAELT